MRPPRSNQLLTGTFALSTLLVNGIAITAAQEAAATVPCIFALLFVVARVAGWCTRVINV